MHYQAMSLLACWLDHSCILVFLAGNLDRDVDVLDEIELCQHFERQQK